MQKGQKFKKREHKRKEQLLQNYIKMLEENSGNRADNREHLMNIKMKENLKVTKKKFNHEDYMNLLKELEKTEINEKYVKEMDTKVIPYEIPEAYSLNETIKKIAIIETKMDKISAYIKRTDMEAVSADWRKIGRCINEAIFKSTGIYTRKSN